MSAVARSIYLVRAGQLSITAAQAVNHLNPLSIIGAAKMVDTVDDVVEAGSQAGVAAARGG